MNRVRVSTVTGPCRILSMRPCCKLGYEFDYHDVQTERVPKNHVRACHRCHLCHSRWWPNRSARPYVTRLLPCGTVEMWGACTVDYRNNNCSAILCTLRGAVLYLSVAISANCRRTPNQRHNHPLAGWAGNLWSPAAVPNLKWVCNRMNTRTNSSNLPRIDTYKYH